MAIVTFNAQMNWSGQGLFCEGGARQFRVSVDEPKELGGSDMAMNPVELVLCALGGCMAICASAFARSCGVDLRGFRVDLSGDLDPDGFTGKRPDVRKGYQEIRYKMHVDSPSHPENVKKLVDLIEERCPVSDTLRGVRVIRG